MMYATCAVVGAAAGYIDGATTGDPNKYEEKLIIRILGSVTIAGAVVAFKALSMAFAQLGVTKLAIGCATVSGVGFSIGVVVVPAAVSMIAYGYFNDKL